ncbi:MAG: phosphoenolpyruvate carboxylase [Polyangiaceae bacterium]
MDADPFEPLRRDVSALGRILGEALIEQEGSAFFDLEERIRGLSKDRRARPHERKAAAELRAAIAALETSTAERVARAFAHYFQVVNLAEQYHRVRRYRDYARAGESRLGPLAELARNLLRIPRSETEALLGRASVELVFTAHPTEAQRRTVLDKHRRIAALLERLDRDVASGAAPVETEETTAALREEITILWETEEIRQERPRVGDEVKNALFYLEEILHPLVPQVYATLERALEEAYGAAVRVPPILHFGSWVGADMDGNPNVTPEIALDTAFAHAARAVALHIRQIDRLGARLSQSWRRTGVSRELLDSLRRDYALHPILAESLEPRPTDEPYRQKLRWAGARLAATREAFVRARAGAPTEFGVGYASADELHEDLALLERSLLAHGGAHAGLADVRGVLRQVEVFGFHLAQLDVRVPAEWVRASVRAALGLGSEAPLTAPLLNKALSGPSPAAPKGDGSAGMRAMEALAEMRRRVTKRSAESFILSMTHGYEDMLAALVLARIAGLYRPEDGVAELSIVPLFETLNDLERCGAELSRAVADPGYARYVSLRGGTQEVMVGYSDSNKDAGIVASSLALYGAQKEIVALERATGIRVKVFHGRGGSIGRGGGPSQRAIEGLPPGSIDGRFKLTEQGEVLGWKYLLPSIAERNLELTLGGVLGASLPRAPRDGTSAAELRRGQDQDESDAAERAEFEKAFDRAAATSLAAYRGLVHHPRFVEYFQQSTPLDEIGALPLGSRPARRSGAASLDDLRAIPWVFAWNQSRQMVPGWFGAGRALQELVRERGAPFVRRMREGWRFFATTLDAVAVALATADMPIAAEYASLVEDQQLARSLFRMIALDYFRAVKAIRTIADRPTLLAPGSTLARSIELRNPYVDPLSFIQIELLRRKRALLREGKAVPQDLQRAILLTINGVAAGLRNTG